MTLITDLTTAGIINEEDAINLEADLKKQTSPLKTLYFFFESKVFERPAMGGFHFSMDFSSKYNSDDEGANETTATYLKLLDILFQHSVISEVIYLKLKTFPLTANKNTYLGALYLASELSSFYQNFTLKKQLEFMELLCGRDEFGRDAMVDYRKKAKLARDIKNEKIETYLDFFRYSYCCNFINLSTYQGKPKQLLNKLTKVLNMLFYQSGFTISDISIYEKDFFGEPSYDNKQTTLIINTGARKHEFSYTFSVGKDRTLHVVLLILENSLKFVNQLLADYACSYRFTGITNTLNKALFTGAGEIFAICRVEESNKHIFEFRMMQSKFLFTRPIHLFYNPPLSYTHIEYAIYHFRECGLLSHLTEEELNKVINKLFNETYEQIGNLLNVFPSTIAVVNHNVAPGEKPYLKFLQTLNAISHGVLNFADINDGLPDQFEYETESEFKVLFTCNDKSHKVNCILNYKNFDQSLIYYIINDIIRKDQYEFQLVNIIGVYGYDYFLFASNEQIKYLDHKKLLLTIPRF